MSRPKRALRAAHRLLLWARVVHGVYTGDGGVAVSINCSHECVPVGHKQGYRKKAKTVQ